MSVEAKDSVEAITKLTASVDPAEVFEVLAGVVMQRLAQRLCSQCRIWYEPTTSELTSLGVDTRKPGMSFARRDHSRAPPCAHTGYDGMVAVTELLYRPRCEGGTNERWPMGYSVMSKLLSERSASIRFDAPVWPACRSIQPPTPNLNGKPVTLVEDSLVGNFHFCT